VVSHCEDLAIIDGGIIHKGHISERLGVKGMDRLSEDSITERECRLAAQTACPVAHRPRQHQRLGGDHPQSQREGTPVTCETAPHYLLLTDELLLKKDANCRMNPPLREREEYRR
jgi:dihydroorotase